MGAGRRRGGGSIGEESERRGREGPKDSFKVILTSIFDLGGREPRERVINRRKERLKAQKQKEINLTSKQ